MSVRKRTWTTRKGEQKDAWIVDYVDQQGDRHIETFAKKKDADARHASVTVDVDKGTHTAASKSITVAQAAQDWLKYVELEGREPATILGYRVHVNRHIVPRIGRERLAKLNTPASTRCATICWRLYRVVWRGVCLRVSKRFSRTPIVAATWRRTSRGMS